MGRGTQGFQYTGGDGANPIGSAIRRILAAREMAENERQYAEKIAEKNDTSLDEAGVEKGYFFKKALGHQFGGDAIASKKEDLNNLVERGKLLKNPRENFWKVFKKQKKTSSLQRFRAQFDYTAVIDDPSQKPSEATPTTPVAEGSAQKVTKATRGSGKVSKEELFQHLRELVLSLERITQSISDSSQRSADSIGKVASTQTELAEQLKHRTSTLESKLDDIAAAIQNQTQFTKQTIDKAEDKSAENKLESVRVGSDDVETFDDLTTEENEQKEDPRNVDTTPDKQVSQEPLPQAEQGAIFSGPNSGYDVTLHGNEMVVPIDNNYTRGLPSAVDGKVRKSPYQSFEAGTRTPGVTPVTNLTLNTTKVTSPQQTQVNLGGNKNQYMNEALVEAMEMPFLATGASLLSTTSEYLKSFGSEQDGIRSDTLSLMRPIASIFGLPPGFIQKAVGGVSSSNKKSTPEGGEDGGDNKNLFEKMFEGFGGLLEGLTNRINNGRRGPGTLLPGDAPAEIKALMSTISGGEGVVDSIQGHGSYAGLEDMTIDEALVVANRLINEGKSETGALGAFQMHSSYLRQRAIDAGLDPSKDKFSMENQTKIMRNFMTQVWTAGGGGDGEAGMLQALKSGNLESEVFPKLSKDLGWPSLPGGSQPNTHTTGAAQRYQQNLQAYQAASTSPPPAGGDLTLDSIPEYDIEHNDPNTIVRMGQEIYKTNELGAADAEPISLREANQIISSSREDGYSGFRLAPEFRVKSEPSIEPPEQRRDQEVSYQRPRSGQSAEPSIAMLNIGDTQQNNRSSSKQSGEQALPNRGHEDSNINSLYPRDGIPT